MTQKQRVEQRIDSIRELVRSLHQEVYNLRWDEGTAGERALVTLSDEYANLAKRVVETGEDVPNWNGGILEQVATLEAMAKLTAPRV